MLVHRLPAILYLATGLVSERSPDRLRWGDLRDAVATRFVEIGAHTHGHVNLSAAGEREASEEMRRSKELIEDEIGVSCRLRVPWAVSSPPDRAARALFGRRRSPRGRSIVADRSIRIDSDGRRCSEAAARSSSGRRRGDSSTRRSGLPCSATRSLAEPAAPAIEATP